MDGGPLGLTEFLFGGAGLFGPMAFFRRLSQWCKQLPSGFLRSGLSERHIWRGRLCWLAGSYGAYVRGVWSYGRIELLHSGGGRVYSAAYFGGAAGLT